MSEKEIRENLIKIQKKWYTPTTKIAKDVGVHSSLVGKFIQDKMQNNANPSPRLLASLEKWVLERIN